MQWMLNQLGGNGMIMVGEKRSVITGGRPNDARIIMPKEEWAEFNKKGWEKTIPRVRGNSQYKEFIDAVRGDGPMPSSDFEYGSGLTEMALVGVMAQRFNKRVEFDAKAMKVTNHSKLNAYIKEPTRK